VHNTGLARPNVRRPRTTPTAATSGASPTNHNRIRRLPRHHSSDHATTSNTGRGELSKIPSMFRVRWMTTAFRAQCGRAIQPVPTLPPGISGSTTAGCPRPPASSCQDGVGTPFESLGDARAVDHSHARDSLQSGDAPSSAPPDHLHNREERTSAHRHDRTHDMRQMSAFKSRGRDLRASARDPVALIASHPVGPSVRAAIQSASGRRTVLPVNSSSPASMISARY
jgi:hypothetical protein